MQFPSFLFVLISCGTENFSDGLKLRAGVYFVDTLPRTHNGKLMRNKATKMAEEKFIIAMGNDPDVRNHLFDISVGYRKLISQITLNNDKM